MAAKKAAAPVTEAPEATALVTVEAVTALAVLTDPERFDRFYEDVKKQTESFTPDVTTPKGRKEIASMAYRVAQTKTAIDAAGLKLTEEARAQIAKVNDSRSAIRDKLDALKAQVREPLTKWEQDEEARQARVKALLDRLKALAVVTIDDTSQDVGERLTGLKLIELVEDELQDYHPIAVALKETATETLTAAHARLVQAEKDAADLARLREQDAERQRLADEKAEADRLEREAAEAEQKRIADEEAERQRQEQARLDAEAEEKRLADEQAERERLAAEKAADDARKAEQDAAAARQRERDEAHAAELAQSERLRKEAEDRAEKERLDREADEKRRADEKAAEDARAKDRAHRGKLMGEAKAAIMEATDVTEPQAKAIVLAICSASVPHVQFNF